MLCVLLLLPKDGAITADSTADAIGEVVRGRGNSDDDHSDAHGIYFFFRHLIASKRS